MWVIRQWHRNNICENLPFVIIFRRRNNNISAILQAANNRVGKNEIFIPFCKMYYVTLILDSKILCQFNFQSLTTLQYCVNVLSGHIRDIMTGICQQMDANKMNPSSEYPCHAASFQSFYRVMFLFNKQRKGWSYNNTTLGNRFTPQEAVTDNPEKKNR